MLSKYVDDEFGAIARSKADHPNPDLDFATRVRAGKMSDRIVAKKKGFKLKPGRNEIDLDAR